MSADAPALLRREEPLAPMTTIGTGGPARFFARVGTRAELPPLLAWARDQHEAVFVLGSGSNLLVADEGVAGLVIKLDRRLAGIEVDGRRLLCGGGARLPALAARAAREGLSGIEFGVNIPGTLGGAVRMNANAYGGELARVLEWVEIAGPGGYQRRPPRELGFAYRSSSLREGEVVAGACVLLQPAPVDEVKGTLQEMRRRRHEAQPQGIRTFGSTFKNPDAAAAGERTAGMLLQASGCAGLALGGARFAPKHANFIENTGSARTSDVVELMAEGRRRVFERFGVELEPEVHTLGAVRFPWRR
jgi:UDP-N-acetylenolpyruvoylglucosamine reductase